MLNFKRYAVHMRPEILEDNDEIPCGSYCQYFLDAVDELDSKVRAREHFGPGWEVMDVFGPFENLELTT